MSTLSIGFCTSKKQPRFDWLVDSLCLFERPHFELVVVDLWLWYESYRADELAEVVRGRFPVVHLPPKPNQWQGPMRATAEDHWAVSNARNTALDFASGARMLWLDDLSIVLPGCLTAHAKAINLFGQGWLKYRKMAVREGAFTGGVLVERDPREPTKHSTNGEYAWSNNLSFPVAAAKKIGGYDEAYDGARRGSDSDFGVRLARAGTPFTFDPTVTQLLSTDDQSFLPPGKEPEANPKLWAQVLKERTRTTAVKPGVFVG